MVAHVVLFRPRANVSETERQAMFNALRAASRDIPSVRRFQIGNRVVHGAGYEQRMAADYPYTAIIEFDDLAGLEAYLAHPQHEELGHLFYALLDSALVYDYEMRGIL